MHNAPEKPHFPTDLLVQIHPKRENGIRYAQ